MAGIVLIDWENIYYTLERDYRVNVRALSCLRVILGEVKRLFRESCGCIYGLIAAPAG